MSDSILKQYITDIFNGYAEDGIVAFKKQSDLTLELSHVCLKFTTPDIYKEYVAEAQKLGVVTHQQFKGKEISWCKLSEPLLKGDLMLEWLEIIEPKSPYSYTGASSIGYAAKGLNEPVILNADHPHLFFRYQSKHAREMALE